jgi:hypothetical protein
MLSLAQHADYAQHLSVYAVSCTVYVLQRLKNCLLNKPSMDIAVVYGMKQHCYQG